MFALALSLSLLGMEPATFPGVDRIVDRLDQRGVGMEQALDRHAGAITDAGKNLVTGIVDLGRDIFWGCVILGIIWLAGKVLDIVKVVVAAKNSS